MENTKKATFYLNTELLKALKLKALFEGKTISALVQDLLSENIDKNYIKMSNVKSIH